jgi:hypothetical protein
MKGRRHVRNTLTFCNRPYLQDIIFQDSKTDYDGGTGFEQVAENRIMKKKPTKVKRSEDGWRKRIDVYYSP